MILMIYINLQKGSELIIKKKSISDFNIDELELYFLGKALYLV